jgi:glycosyltransferase involved in cell wall biosynthesis
MHSHIAGASLLTAATVEKAYVRAMRSALTHRGMCSVFTTSFMSGENIRIAYRSLLRQTFTDWEWVIVDDSPPEDGDATWRVLQQLGAEDYRVRAYKLSEHSGYIGEVKQLACRLARGDMLVELDHDDELVPDCLQWITEAAAKHPAALFFYTHHIEAYDGGDGGECVQYCDGHAFGSGVHYRCWHDGRWAIAGALCSTVQDKTMRYIVGVPNHVRAWRRSAYDAVGGHNRLLPVADDYELILRTLMHQQWSSVHIKRVGYIQYRSREGNNFTYLRNSLIQRLTRIVAGTYNEQIHHYLLGCGLEDACYRSWQPEADTPF